MKKLVLAVSMAILSIAGLERPSSALAPTYCSGTFLRYYYYDCTTGAYCGSTDYICGEDPQVTGCQTACFQLVRASCTCPLITE